VAQAAAAATASPHSENSLENLPALLGRLGDQVSTLVDTKIDLLKVEVKEEANTYLHQGITILTAGVVAAVGFALLNVAAALGVSLLFVNAGLTPTASYALGFVVTGLFFLIIGGTVAVITKNRVVAHDPAPQRTIQELRKDKQWLTKEF
jgi:uncharacterized membrane protein YqjE